tara:strand:- start:73967 stop:74509 length:543 start_codon:yes stop_codon:yes gene_type:complete
MRIVIIPYWLQTTLLRNGLSLRDCCDKDAFKPYVSNGDLRRYQDAQHIGASYLADRFKFNIQDLLSVGVNFGSPIELDNKENDFVCSVSDNLEVQHVLVGRALTPDLSMSVHANPMALNSGEIVLAITVNVETSEDRPGFESEAATHFFKDLNEALYNCHVPISSLANCGLLSAYVNRLN